MNIFRYNHIFARLALSVTFLGITYLALAPSSGSLPTAGNDKLNHFLAFYLLALLVDYSFPSVKFHYIKILSLVGYGAIIEIVQFFTPSRSCSLYDLLADTIAVFSYIITRELLRFSIYSRKAQLLAKQAEH
jgi:VanZ family protein